MPSPNISPNVYGIETEYSLMLTLPGNITHELVGSCHSKDSKLGLYQQPAYKGSASLSGNALPEALAEVGLQVNSRGMLSNGGRFYVDPSGPEYDTPETKTAEEAVHRTYDGDELMLGVLHAMRDAGHIEGFQLNRRIVDHNRTSRGIHLNTMSGFAAEGVPQDVVARLATVNVIKGALFGSGGLLLDDTGRTHFHHSPRLSLTNQISTSFSTARPLVRTPFKREGKRSRIETITSDALSFAWPLRASMVLTNAATHLLELERPGSIPLLRDPVKAALIVGRHGNANQISVIDGESYKGFRPADIVRHICEQVLEADDKYEHLDPESEQVINEIIEVAESMSKDVFLVAGRVESIARWIAMKKKMDKEKITIDSERMCRFDYAWDLLGGGVAETFRKDKNVGWHGFTNGYSRRAAQKRLTTAPRDTRATIRAKLILEGKGEQVTDWSKVASPWDKKNTRYIPPFQTELSSVPR